MLETRLEEGQCVKGTSMGWKLLCSNMAANALCGRGCLIKGHNIREGLTYQNPTKGSPNGQGKFRDKEIS